LVAGSIPARRTILSQIREQNKRRIIMGKLMGKIAIGAATARRLAAEGASVVLGDINVETAGKVAAEIVAAGGVAVAVHCDIGIDSSVEAMVAAAVRLHGGLDLIHINAADLSIIGKDLDALAVSLDIFDRTIAIDLRGHLLCTRRALPELLKRGGGAIVYTTSGASWAGETTRIGYGAAKSGVNAIMRHVAARWGKEGIRSNAVSPGLVLSETALNEVSKERLALLLEATKSPRLGKPEDIAAAVAFLMSDEAEWINGQILTVDGGMSMR
jgi:NAD(P)-dependent dehydrogenase (short-subunit alcohol dehydrogenase family)